MIGYLRDIERRRAVLVERSNAQRAALAEAVSPMTWKLAALDRIAAGVRWGTFAFALYSLLRRG